MMDRKTHVMLKPLAWMLIVTLLSSSTVALAEDPPADIAFIRRPGIPTPFPGVLMTDEVYARWLAEREIMQERCDGRLRLELGLQGARKDLATATTANDLRSVKASCDDRLTIKDQRITQLEGQLVEADKKAHMGDVERVLWFGGGMLAVIAAAVVVHLVIKPRSAE